MTQRQVRATTMGCLLAATLLAQNEVFVPANDVSFTISTERKNFGVRERVTVKYRILNVSNRPLYVPRGFDATACLEGHQAGPHVRAGFENGAGKHFYPGYLVSCGGTPGAAPPTIAERMGKIAVLLHPGEHFDGAVELNPAVFHLPAGTYRIEAVLYGWKSEQFSDAERTELERMRVPLLTGEVPTSEKIDLLADR
jgi:hypothetical protein